MAPAQVNGSVGYNRGLRILTDLVGTSGTAPRSMRIVFFDADILKM
jgi:hypothetical protein